MLKNTFLAIFLSGMLLLPMASADSGDLVLFDGDVTFSQSYFLEGHTIRIWANPANHSPSDLLGSVSFSSHLGSMGPNQPISILAGSSDAVFLDWTPNTFGRVTITVTVIPFDSTDDNPNNNTVTKTFFIEQDTDYDGIANQNDPDDDNDGVNDEEDLYPLNWSESTDTDGDGIGDNADDDDDNDTILDADDAFPLDALHSSDIDNDQIPDEEDPDIDGDDLANTEEPDFGTDPQNPDTDGDGTLDGHDPFPLDPNESADSDSDGIGDNSDEDIDGDGILNAEDPAPLIQAPSVDTDKLYTAKLDEELTFSAYNPTDTEGETLIYSWEFLDGEVILGSEITRTFDTIGLQSAILTVSDQNDQSSSTEFNIRISNNKLLWILGSIFSLLLLLLAFYLIYRYTRRASEKKQSKKKKL